MIYTADPKFIDFMVFSRHSVLDLEMLAMMLVIGEEPCEVAELVAGSGGLEAAAIAISSSDPGSGWSWLSKEPAKSRSSPPFLRLFFE